MDLFMPGLDGAEATRRIRAMDGQAASVPVIGLSGSILPSDRRHCIESGMTDFLSKPFAPAEIAPRLLNWIDGRTA
jgi:CheY-like chemotaxis protein